MPSTGERKPDLRSADKGNVNQGEPKTGMPPSLSTAPVPVPDCSYSSSVISSISTHQAGLLPSQPVSSTSLSSVTSAEANFMQRALPRSPRGLYS